MPNEKKPSDGKVVRLVRKPAPVEPVKPKDDPSGATDLTGQRAGRAFQILAVPGKPKPR